MREIEFSYREMKLHATVDCLDIETKTSNVLRETLLDMKCWTSFEDEGPIRLTWVDLILFSTR